MAERLANLSAASGAAVSKAPCWLLTLNEITILLDCAFAIRGPLSNAVNCIPRIDPDIVKSIDVVLVSNHESFLALPFITEYHGFQGKVFATNPTLAFGKLRMEAFIRSDRKVSSFDGTLLDCYSQNEALSCLSKFTNVQFKENISIGPVTLTALSSGFCLGATNWMITYHFQSIAYIATSSTLLNAHSAPMDVASLKIADYVITNNAAPSAISQTTKSIMETSGKRVFSELSRAIENGMTVVFLCKPYGVLFDLLELVESAFGTMGMTTSVHVVSGVANESLKVCNILGEWMNAERKERLFKSTIPLGHGNMLESKRLLTHSSMHTVFVEKPQVLFLDYSDLDNAMLSAFLKWRRGGRFAQDAEFVSVGGYQCYPLAGILDVGYPNVLRRELRGKVSKKVVLATPGYIGRLLENAMSELNGVCVEKSASKTVIDIEIGRLVFFEDKLLLEAADMSTLSSLVDWAHTLKGPTDAEVEVKRKLLKGDSGVGAVF
ncbi:Integrator complex subunit 9 [Entophlyctis luteolus]|nr:Integrator complex subunit 9 [Entophlyctis luteolus]